MKQPLTPRLFSITCLVALTILRTISANAQAVPTIQWQKSLGGSASDIAQAIQQTTDGGYIVAGFSCSNDGNVSGHHGDSLNGDCWVVKLTSSGIIEWQKSLGGSGQEWASSIQQTSDGGYIVAGNTRSNDGDVTGLHGAYADYWIVKLSSSGAIEWQKTLGGSFPDYANCIRQTRDGGYIVAGRSSSNDGDVIGLPRPFPGANFDYWIVKLSSSGAVEWQQTLGSSGGEEAFSIQQTNDGGYIVAGSTQCDSTRIDCGYVTGQHGSFDCWIVKLTSLGAIVWQRTFGGSMSDFAYCIQQTNDGGYIFGGSTESNDGDVTNYHGNLDCWIVKLDSVGRIRWQKTLGGSGSDEVRSVQQTSDSGFIVAGSTTSNDGDVSGNHGISQDFWIVKLDSVGGIAWQKTLGGSSVDQAFSIQQTSDTGFIVAGESYSNDGDVSGNHISGTSYGDCWIVKLGRGIPVIASLDTSRRGSLVCTSTGADTIHVRNIGTAALVITAATITGSAASEYSIVSPTVFPDTIAAGDSSRFVVRLTAASIGAKTATLSIVNNDLLAGHNPWNIVLTSRRDTAALALAPSTLSFGELPACMTPRDSFVVLINTGTVEDTVTVSMPPDVSIISPMPRHIAAGSRDTIVVRFHPAVRDSTINENVIFTSMPCAVRITLDVRGKVDAFTNIPSTLNFGSRRVGAPDTCLAFVLHNPSPFAVHVARFVLSPPAAPVTVNPIVPQTIPARDSITVTVCYAPTASLNLSATVNAIIDAPCADTVLCTVLGRGVNSALLVSKNVISLNSLPCSGAPMADTVVLTNMGTTDLNVTCTISGSNAADFSLDPPQAFTLTPSSSTRLILHGHPSSTGTSTASLIVTSDNPNHPRDTIALSARHDTAALAALQPVVTFADMPSCLMPRDTVITVLNNGTVVDTVDVTCGANLQVLSPLPRYLLPGARDTITIRFSPAARNITIDDSVVIDARPCALHATIAVHGRAGTYTFVPDTVDFGNTQVHDSLCMILYLRNPNPGAVRVSALALLPPSATQMWISGAVVPLTIPGRDSIAVTVCYAPDDSTRFSAVLTAFVDLPCADTIRSTLLGHGIKSDLAVSPRALDFGTLDLCTVRRDSIQLCNRGTAPITIAAFTLSGADSAHFSLPAAPLPLTIVAGACTWMVIQCDTDAMGEGVRRATLNIVPQDATLATLMASIIATRAAPVLAMPGVVDFGPDTIGVARDTVVMLHNIGTLPLCVDALSAAGGFTLTLPTLPATLAPGDSLAVGVRFIPVADSIYRTMMTIAISCPCAEMKYLSLNGQGLLRSVLCTSAATVGLPTAEANVGDAVDIPLSLTAQNNITVCGATAFIWSMQYNRTLLHLVSPAPSAVADSADTRTATFTAVRTDTAGTMSTLHFIATLGDADTTPLHVASFTWTDGAVATSIVDGLFRLKNVCPAGGKRLVNPSGTFSLAQNVPNPFSGETTIEYETIERGPTTLRIVDLLGRTVATLVNEDLIPGRYSASFNARRMSHGVYEYVLQTPSATVGKIMIVAR